MDNNDLAYRLATAGLTTRSMTEKTLNGTPLCDFVWEPLEGFSNDHYREVIDDHAANIKEALDDKDINAKMLPMQRTVIAIVLFSAYMIGMGYIATKIG